MTLLRDQKVRIAQTLQQVKDLARAGQWEEAKRLVDTLPETPDVVRVRERIQKQLFIQTGEIPAIMDNSMAVADMDESIGTRTLAMKAKRDAALVPRYYALYAMSFLLYGLGGLAILGGVILLFVPPTQMAILDITYTTSYRGLGLSFIAMGIGMVVSGELWRVFRDIARNTSLTTLLLQRLLEKEG